MFVVRYDAVVNRVRVVQLTTAVVADQLLKLACQALQIDVIDGRRQHHDVVTERRNSIDAQLGRFQCFLSRLQYQPQLKDITQDSQNLTLCLVNSRLQDRFILRLITDSVSP